MEMRRSENILAVETDDQVLMTGNWLGLAPVGYGPVTLSSAHLFVGVAPSE